MKFRILTKPDCRYCTLAKAALQARGLSYDEEEVTPERFAELKANGMTTVPQIWVEHPPLRGFTTHIGGFTELTAWLKNEFDR